jgi:hypothetical protein
MTALARSLIDRIHMRDNKRELLRQQHPKLSDDTLARKIDTIEWEFRRGVQDDIDDIIKNGGVFKKPGRTLAGRDLSGAIADYIIGS